MYEPPIKLIMGEMQTQFEENCMRAVQSYGFDVDKNELVKALEYDRNQYEKDYADGRHDAVEVVRCGDCKWYCVDEHQCKHQICMLVFDDDFCSYGERKEVSHEET